MRYDIGALLSCTTTTVPDFGEDGIVCCCCCTSGVAGAGGVDTLAPADSTESGVASKEGPPLLLIIACGDDRPKEGVEDGSSLLAMAMAAAVLALTETQRAVPLSRWLLFSHSGPSFTFHVSSSSFVQLFAFALVVVREKGGRDERRKREIMLFSFCTIG